MRSPSPLSPLVCFGGALLAAFVASAAHAAGPHFATGMKIGEVTADSAIVWTRLTASDQPVPDDGKTAPPKTVADDALDQVPGAAPGMAGQVRLLISPNADFAGARQLPAASVTEATDFCHQWRIAELQPATRYHVRAEALDPSGQVRNHFDGSFSTAPRPGDWADVRFAAAGCQAYHDRDDPAGLKIYRAMAQAGLDFAAITGDDVYYDSDPPNADTVAAARFHWARMYSQPLLVEFHRRVPSFFEKDDHDTMKNDSWPPPGPNADRSDELTGKLNFFKGIRIFREQVPMGEKTYRTFRWGQGLQIWLTEGRDFRSPNNMADGPEKTIWGREQLAWLKESILASDATFRVLISPTPIVGPDRDKKADNHANQAFFHEGNAFRQWTKENKLTNLFVCCGDRHWQYHSVDPASGLHEFSCGGASDSHAGGSPGLDPAFHRFHRVKGGFVSGSITRADGIPTITFRHHDVNGKVVYEFQARK
ncbi:MAG: alkaline phosphatase D family protein [Pirellulaceae bacterium]|nr:alkaline phosphatase D family protein [Pirellulaceae bacterium]